MFLNLFELVLTQDRKAKDHASKRNLNAGVFGLPKFQAYL